MRILMIAKVELMQHNDARGIKLESENERERENCVVTVISENLTMRETIILVKYYISRFYW